MKSNKHRVFFHEIGHFVANEINHAHFGVSQVEKIRLTRHELGNSTDYIGETIYAVPEGEDRNKPLQNLPPKLANLIYGCYFQSIYQNTELEMCFDFSNSSANGKVDMDHTIAALTQFQVSAAKRREFYPLIKEQYFKTLLSRKEDFIYVFKLSPENYFIEINEFVTEVDLENLRIDLSSFIELHTDIYLSFVSEIMRILDWDTLNL